MKPVIGIFPSYCDETKRIYLNNQYLEEIIRSGGIPYIIPMSSDQKTVYDIIKNIDGLILSGGSDIDPKYYGQSNSGKSVGISEFMDECEAVLVRLAVEDDLPILGICRGMQALNIFCGGSMMQDIPSEKGFAVCHRLEKPEVAYHSITVEKESPLSDTIGFGTHTVNSYHHQAVKNIAPEFSVAATAEDGIVEAIYHKNKKFILGIQWHPERNHDKVSANKKILDNFIKICSLKENDKK